MYPAGSRVGFSRVRVRVLILVPAGNPYPSIPVTRMYTCVYTRRYTWRVTAVMVQYYVVGAYITHNR